MRFVKFNGSVEGSGRGPEEVFVNADAVSYVRVRTPGSSNDVEICLRGGEGLWVSEEIRTVLRRLQTADDTPAESPPSFGSA
jgi:hypothetical protein